MTEGKTKRENSGLLIVLVVVTLALLAGWFLWFELRPAVIRSLCDKQARKAGIALEIEIKYGIPDSDSVKTYQLLYESCLHSKGLY